MYCSRIRILFYHPKFVSLRIIQIYLSHYAIYGFKILSSKAVPFVAKQLERMRRRSNESKISV